MPLTTTHALIPLAGVLALSDRPISWRLVSAAAFASAAPDLDGLVNHFWKFSPGSILLHRGATHSLFVALAAGAIAALFARLLKAQPLTAAVVVTAAMATHGLLDMMADTGRPVAYLWPLTSVPLYADWRPIHSGTDRSSTLLSQGLFRFELEAWQVVIPMFACAFIIRFLRRAWSAARPADDS